MVEWETFSTKATCASWLSQLAEKCNLSQSIIGMTETNGFITVYYIKNDEQTEDDLNI